MITNAIPAASPGTAATSVATAAATTGTTHGRAPEPRAGSVRPAPPGGDQADWFARPLPVSRAAPAASPAKVERLHRPPGGARVLPGPRTRRPQSLRRLQHLRHRTVGVAGVLRPATQPEKESALHEGRAHADARRAQRPATRRRRSRADRTVRQRRPSDVEEPGAVLRRGAPSESDEAPARTRSGSPVAACAPRSKTCSMRCGPPAGTSVSPSSPRMRTVSTRISAQVGDSRASRCRLPWWAARPLRPGQRPARAHRSRRRRRPRTRAVEHDRRWAMRLGPSAGVRASVRHDCASAGARTDLRPLRPPRRRPGSCAGTRR